MYSIDTYEIIGHCSAYRLYLSVLNTPISRQRPVQSSCRFMVNLYIVQLIKTHQLYRALKITTKEFQGWHHKTDS